MERHVMLKKARNESGLLQKELAKRVGCSQQTVVDIESGKIRKSKYLPEICAELGIDYNRLVSGDAVSQADLVSFDFGTPVPVIRLDQVADWLAGRLTDLSAVQRHPCPVKHGFRAFAVTASGTAMDPDIRHGDLVHVDPDQGWQSGDIVCLFVGSAAAPLFRQVFSEGAEVYAVAAHDEKRTDLHLVKRLDELESSALALLEGGSVAYIAGKAIFSGRLYT